MKTLTLEQRLSKHRDGYIDRSKIDRLIDKRQIDEKLRRLQRGGRH